jgi:hypothetical protein
MRIRTRLAVLAVIPALALGTGIAAAGAAMADNSPPPAMNISFLSGAQSSAHWNPAQQSVSTHVGLTTGGPVGGPIASCGSPGDRTTLGDYIYGCGYTKIVLNHFLAALPTQEPTFSTTFYQSGTPRWYILFSSGDYMFGYPDGTAPNGFSWEAHVGGTVTYGNWTTLSALMANSGTVTVVRIVCDASAPTPYDATISAIQYDGVYPQP